MKRFCVEFGGLVLWHLVWLWVSVDVLDLPVVLAVCMGIVLAPETKFRERQ